MAQYKLSGKVVYVVGGKHDAEQEIDQDFSCSSDGVAESMAKRITNDLADTHPDHMTLQLQRGDQVIWQVSQ